MECAFSSEHNILNIMALNQNKGKYQIVLRVKLNHNTQVKIEISAPPIISTPSQLIDTHPLTYQK